MDKLTVALFLAFVALASGQTLEFTNPKTGISYVYVSSSSNYQYAKAFCEEEYDGLARPKTIAESTFIANQLKARRPVDVWLGLESFGNGSTPTRWLDGTPLKSWTSFQKNIGTFQCNAVLLNVLNYWWVNGCTYNLAAALCQKKEVEVVPLNEELLEKIRLQNNEITSLKQSVADKTRAIDKLSKELINERVIVSQLRNEIKRKDSDCNERVAKILGE